MKRIFALATTAIVFGVAFIGSVTTCQIPVGYGAVDVSADVNVSFLAPVPINYTVVPLITYHEIYLGSQEFFHMEES